MSNCDYMRIKLAAIPQDIIDQYGLGKIQHEGWVYIEIQKGMPGLKQTSKIANDRLCALKKNTDMHHFDTQPRYGNTSQ